MSYPYDPNQPPNYGQGGYGQPYGAYVGGPPPGPEPDNNLVWAILTTVLCCLPLGIVAIVKSTSVSKLWAAGDFAGAQKAADDAKKWAMWGAIAGVVGSILIVVAYVLFFVVLFGTAATTSTY
ncbi:MULTISPECIES: CD225/dispanin family protein [Gordonia]|uniref:CD225/dispanin family protein n=1 Tax=Gordonia amicalis TaxID=89053 RepID=A0AAE4R2J6_9ACTN|nr:MULTISPECIES: CD225/dispanin family protein [Gordonia]ATD69575.1 hypothetical protein CNO18_03910 [Gordonia sp. 1D]KAF0970875.1 hypothetical protein BPODLACK_00057 [Gordonia sp. YY1]MBA5848964.1 CD225/dispanin family protein [Gordonia amicalis]MCR8896709.1 CD225/dispanin family protein [Gordonia sp. GONU]MCZ0911572.1 CD225/dispanin family protein [Gordonia amicalis]